MNHRSRRVLFLGLLLAGWSVALRAEEGPTLPAQSRVSEGRYAEVRKQLTQGKGSEAVEALQELIESGGGSLVAVDGRHYLQARQAGQIELARLGRKEPDLLRQYRRRIDEQAGRRLKEALAEGDDKELRLLVEEMFCSSAAVQALDRLGDAAFERGRFAEALAWWRQLAPWPEYSADLLERGPVLVHPGPVPPALRARVGAKQMLARLFAGGDERWQADLDAYRERHGEMGGKLAGRSGPYAAILAEMARHPPRPPASEGWRAFAGAPTRQHIVPAEEDAVEHISRLCGDGPTWTLNLEERALLQEPLAPQDGNVPDSLQARTLAFHPLVLGSRLILADARFVMAIDLHTGKSSEWYDVARFNGGLQLRQHLPAPPDLRYTLAAGADCVYARLGVQGLRPEELKGAPEARPEPRADSESFLVCLSLEPDINGNRERWCLRGRMHGVIYEGAPVVGPGNLYVAATRFSGDRAITSIDCYAADTAGEPPLRWRREVCNSRPPRADAPRYRHHLLTLAGRQVVYCSDTGVIAAVDAGTGQPSWALRYPRLEAGGEDRPPLRDLTPPVFAEGRLYVAPTDSDHLLCLDPVTGRILWEREGLQVVHLLGVGQGRLIFTTREGLRAVGAADGSDASGWALPDAGGELLPMGRGLLLGDVVLWPVARVQDGFPLRRVVYAVRQRDGRPANDPALLHNLPGGNLVYANGCLVSCGARTAWVFVRPSWHLPQRRQQAQEHPRSPRAALALARAEADAGRLENALLTLDRADDLARGQPGKLFLPQVEDERERFLREAFRQAVRKGHEAETEQWARQVQRCRQSPAEAARALVRVASLWERSGQPARALRVWQHLFAEKVRDALIEGEGTPARAADLALAQVERLRRVAPDAFAEVMETPARRLWEQTPRPGTALCLRLVQEYPHTETARAALRQLVKQEREAGHWGAAAQALRLQLAGSAEEGEQEELRRQLTAAYQQEQVLPPGAAVAGNGFSPPGETPLFLPWQRTWQVTLPAGHGVLPGVSGLSENPWLLTAGPDGEDRAWIGCRSWETGKEHWTRDVSFRANWTATHADLILLAGKDGVACLRQDDGATVWRLLLSAADRRARPLTDFQLAAGRLFFRRGGSLLAVDAESGRVLWEQIGPGAGLDLPFPAGQVFAHYHAGRQTVLVQTSGRRRLLDAAGGRCLHEAADAAEPWPFPVVAVEEASLCLVPDTRQVVLIDAGTGQEKWRARLPGGSMLDGRPPQVVSRGSVLLVLVSTNVGQMLHRLDLATGKLLWQEPLYLGLPPLDTAAWAVDEHALYLAHAGRLEAWSLDEPRLLWKQPLPDARDWQVQRQGEWLFACPRPGPDTRRLRC